MPTVDAAIRGPPAPRRLEVTALCLLPMGLLAWWCLTLAAKGPYWLGTNLDPDYVYLLNGAGLLHGHAPAHVDHPGTTVQVLVALVVKVTHLLAGRGPLADDVIGRPETYLLVTNVVLLALFAGTLLVAGLAALRMTGSLLAGLAMQLVPGLSPVVVLHVVCVKPEPLLAALTALVAALVLRRLTFGRAEGRVPDAILFGILVGLAVATKITAAPLAVIPMLVLERWAGRLRFAGAAAATAALATLPAWPSLRVFRRLMTGIATHSGRYGSGKPSIFEFSEYLGGLKLLLEGAAGVAPVVIGAAGAVVVLVLVWRAPAPSDRPVLRRSLGACVTMVAASYVLVARHAASHYLLPAMVIAGLAAALIIHAVRQLVPTVSWAARLASAGLAMLVGAGTWQLARGAEENRLWLRDQRQSQLDVVDTLAKRFPGTRVIHFYRSSSVAYALHFGDMYAESRWSSRIEALHPGHLFYNLWNDRLEAYAPRPGDASRPLDYLPLTREDLCGRGQEGPAVVQGSLLETIPSTVKDVKPLAQRIVLVHSSGVEGLFLPTECAEGASQSAPR